MKQSAVKYAITMLYFGMSVVLLSSCGFLDNLINDSETAKPHINGKTVNMKDPAVLNNDTLVYGYTPLRGNYTYIQMNPSKAVMEMTPLLCGDGVFCFPPLEKDMSFQLIYFSYEAIGDFGGTVINRFTPGIGSDGNIAFIIKEAGLQFLGAYAFAADKARSAAAFKPYPKEDQKNYELKCLRTMQPVFKGSKWEAAIAKRIEELENE